MIGLSVHVDQYAYVFMLLLSLLIQEKLVFATVLDSASGLTLSLADGDGGNSQIIQPKLSSTAKPVRSADISNDVVRTLSVLESGLRSTWEASVRCLVEFPVYCPQSPPACSLAAFEALFGASSSKA